MSQVEPTTGITCYCLNHCPDPNVINGTCLTKPGGYCFAASEEVYDPLTDSLDVESTYGCLPPEENGFMQCKGHLVPHEVPKTIACCRDSNFCNLNLKLNLVRTQPSSSNNDLLFHLTIILSTAILLIILFAITFLIFSRRKRRTLADKHLLEDGSTSSTSTSKVDESSNGVYSNSGSGAALLAHRTIAKQIDLLESVGKGRFGEVWKGDYRDDRVAVKIFMPLDEASWLREQDIYQTPLLNHPNILGFIAADVHSADSWSQLLLITEYHHYGSLYDFLQHKKFDERAMLRLMYSSISGICHLHMEIIGKQIKPSIAHRDIKSKNILVKNGHICVIADFGLAVKYDSLTKTLDIPMNTKVGTIRYMPPEVLDDTMIADRFDSYKMADIYSMSLVLWEIGRRCSINGITDDYQLPYFDIVPSDPSFEDMRKVVCVDGRRPLFSSIWNQNKTLNNISKMLSESWQNLPRARLSALRIKKNLARLLEESVATN